MTCSSCPYYDILKTCCRKSTPGAVPLPVGPGTMRIQSFWAPVNKDDWCGEHPERKRKAEGVVLTK